MGRFITKEDFIANKYLEKAELNFRKIVENNKLFDVILKYNSELNFTN